MFYFAPIAKRFYLYLGMICKVDAGGVSSTKKYLPSYMPTDE